MSNIEKNSASESEKYIFSLDIGTRSVIGVVGMMQGDKFKISAIETIEHTKRAMIDGQIEDIEEVAAVAKRVKDSLERQLGFSLTRVCVAAAGRALKTSTAEWSMSVSPNEPISRETLYELEMGAVSLAAEEITKDGGNVLDFYCVGYSVKRFYLDDYAYSTLVGHKGKTARAEVIATFLPREVVESLSAAMSKIGLEIDFLTLEPIAAMNAVIPSELRLLNLALVDIGAGTSDIALCEGNTVTAYTMATVAGDEITEEIIKRYLVDFATAEDIKHKLGDKNDTITFSDIMGFDYTVDKAEVFAAIAGATESLAAVICQKIVECNGHAPAAVFLVGGGSKIASLCELVADNLGLDHRKVAVGGNNFMKRVVVSDTDLCGPEYATPLGIALTAAASGEHHGFIVYLNGERRQLFRSASVSLMDVLLLCGYKYSDILGKNGKSLEYELNGERRIMRGTHLKPAVLKINDEDVSITATVKSGDKIEVAPAESGVDAALSVSQLVVNDKPITVIYDGTPIETGSIVTVNGRRADHDYKIQNKDSIVIEEVITLNDLYSHMGVSRDHASLLVNGALHSGDYKLKDGDKISYFAVAINPEPKEPPVEEPAAEAEPVSATEEIAAPAPAAAPVAAPTPAVPSPAPVAAAEEKQPVPVVAAQPDEEKKPALQPISVMLNGRSRTVMPKSDSSAVLFVDMLNLVDIDPTKPQGDIVLTHNGQPASYLQPIANGDTIEIYWAKRS